MNVLHIEEPEFSFLTISFRRLPPARASKRRIHALPLVDALQQGRSSSGEKAPQWLRHPGSLNEAGEAQATLIPKKLKSRLEERRGEEREGKKKQPQRWREPSWKTPTSTPHPRPPPPPPRPYVSCHWTEQLRIEASELCAASATCDTLVFSFSHPFLPFSLGTHTQSLFQSSPSCREIWTSTRWEASGVIAAPPSSQALRERRRRPGGATACVYIMPPWWSNPHCEA